MSAPLSFGLQSVLMIGLGLLLLTLLLGLIRALRGPILEDRLMSVLLLGSGGVATLLLLALLLAMPALLDVALLLALLGAVAAAAMTRLEVDDV
jgi:multicomponent Na+:H+ antiporter subunit F